LSGRLCIDRKLSAIDIPDAWLAATVIKIGEHLVTFGADFKKLRGRRQVTALSAA
jgi:predicted nucleic acid-binding protein